MSAIYPTPAHSDLADGRKGEHATFAHPRERTRDPLIDHPRPAPPSCCHLPLLPHRCCHTALATWARFGCLYADDATLLLPRHCYHTAMLILPRRRYRAADAALLPLPHCRCGHTAAATLRLLHCPAPANATPTATVPADDYARCYCLTRRLHACHCHTRRHPDRHRHASTGRPHWRRVARGGAGAALGVLGVGAALRVGLRAPSSRRGAG